MQSVATGLLTAVYILEEKYLHYKEIQLIYTIYTNILHTNEAWDKPGGESTHEINPMAVNGPCGHICGSKNKNGTTCQTASHDYNTNTNNAASTKTTLQMNERKAWGPNNKRVLFGP